MKRQARLLGIDDGPFEFDEPTVPVVGAVVQLPQYLEGVLMTEVTVDGNDATDRLAEMALRSRYLDNMAAVLLDGAAVGGFNVVDVASLSARLERPVITVTRDPPDFAAMEKALRSRFPDWERRYALIRQRPVFPVATKHKPLQVSCAGITAEGAEQVVRASIVRGALPEPVRVAHLIATAVRRGESRGRA